MKDWNDPEVMAVMRMCMVGSSTSNTSPKKSGEDLTIDGYINKHGGIFSHADNKVHTSKKSYLEGIKAKGCHIKDYA